MAIKKLKVLGNGFTLIPTDHGYLVQSVPGELTMDHTTVLQQAEVSYMYTQVMYTQVTLTIELGVPVYVMYAHNYIYLISTRYYITAASCWDNITLKGFVLRNCNLQVLHNF